MKLKIYYKSKKGEGKVAKEARVRCAANQFSLNSVFVAEQNLVVGMKLKFHEDEDETPPNNFVIQILPQDSTDPKAYSLNLHGKHSKALACGGKNIVEKGLEMGVYSPIKEVMNGVTYFALMQVEKIVPKAKEGEGAQ